MIWHLIILNPKGYVSSLIQHWMLCTDILRCALKPTHTTSPKLHWETLILQMCNNYTWNSLFDTMGRKNGLGNPRGPRNPEKTRHNHLGTISSCPPIMAAYKRGQWLCSRTNPEHTPHASNGYDILIIRLDWSRSTNHTTMCKLGCPVLIYQHSTLFEIFATIVTKYSN